jgi:hypothetical protein
MGIAHELDLRAVARQAAEVAKLIDQGGRHPGEFQRTVNATPPRRRPDVARQSIQMQLEGVAAAIGAYVGTHAGNAS